MGREAARDTQVCVGTKNVSRDFKGEVEQLMVGNIYSQSLAQTKKLNWRLEVIFQAILLVHVCNEYVTLRSILSLFRYFFCYFLSFYFAFFPLIQLVLYNVSYVLSVYYL